MINTSILTPDNPLLLLGDAGELLKQVPNESVDLIFTSPPYNLYGRNFIGFEKSPQYFEDSKERIEQNRLKLVIQ